MMSAVVVERCEECGFDGSRWTDAEAIAATAASPGRWRRAIAGLDGDDLARRPIAGMWSIAEYTDHVRETAFGMRFLLDVVRSDPGTDLGDPPEPRFDPEPRRVDVDTALAGFESEVGLLCDALRATPAGEWATAVTVGGDDVDIGWIARHAVHDVTHHLGDVDRLRRALDRPADEA